MNDFARDVFERLVAAQNAHDIDALVSCVAPDYSSEQPAHPDRDFVGSEQVRKNWTAMFAGVPDFSAELLDGASECATAWGEFAWRGRKRDGSPLHARGVGRGIEAAVQGLTGKR